MSVDDDLLAVVATVPSEVEGQLLVNILNDHGIAAALTGGFTSQFRAEAPGWVRVMVKQNRLAAARSVLAEQAQAVPAPEPPLGDHYASAYPSRRTGIVTYVSWILLIVVSLELAAILAFLVMRGHGVGSAVVLLIWAAVVAASLRWRRSGTR